MISRICSDSWPPFPPDVQEGFLWLCDFVRICIPGKQQDNKKPVKANVIE